MSNDKLKYQKFIKYCNDKGVMQNEKGSLLDMLCIQIGIFRPPFFWTRVEHIVVATIFASLIFVCIIISDRPLAVGVVIVGWFLIALLPGVIAGSRAYRKYKILREQLKLESWSAFEDRTN